MRLAQRDQRRLVPPHRLHRIGQDQRLEAAPERIVQHGEHVRIHERLAPGEADLVCAHPVDFDLVEEAGDVLRRDIDQRIVGRAALDVAAGAGEIAQGSGVEPQRFERGQRNMRARLALGRHLGIGKFLDRQRRRLDREGRWSGRRVTGFGARTHAKIRLTLATRAAYFLGSDPNTVGSHALKAAAFEISLRVG